MYNKLSADYKKRQINNFDDEPPEKKLVSDGDLLIKELAEKQRNTEVTLEQQLSLKSQFYKSTEVESVTNYTSGFATLEKFNGVLQHLSDVESLKSYGLSDEQINLLHDYQRGMMGKHKNLNKLVLQAQLEEISNTINQPKKINNENLRCDRLKLSTTVAAKPDSVETKLLKFALENEQKSKEKFSFATAMDQIKDVEQNLVNNLSPVNIKKIRKKARSLAKQIEMISTPTIAEPIIKKAENSLFCGSSKWDLKECNAKNKLEEVKVFTCKPQNYYTIKNGEIVRIDHKDNTNEINKLSIEEIKKMPKFENYEKGTLSKVLYFKNLPNGVQDNDLQTLLGRFCKNICNINIMQGRMHGQAFIEFQDEKIAAEALDQCNGTFLKSKPVIIQFGKRNS